MITFHHANTLGSRAARLRIAHLLCHETIVIHVSCLLPCRTWHWPQAKVLSHPFHPLLPSFLRSHLHKQAQWFSTYLYPAMLNGRVADEHKSHLSQVMSLSRLRSKPSTPKQSSLKTSSPKELSLTGILGQIRVNHGKDFWETVSLKMWTNLEKLVQRCPDAFRLWLSGKHCRLGSWRWRTTNNAGFTTVFSGSRGLQIISNTNCTGETCCVVTGERSKCEAYSSWFKRKLDVKFVSGTESTGETCCNVSIRKRRTGKPIEEFCLQVRWPVNLGEIPSWRQ